MFSFLCFSPGRQQFAAFAVLAFGLVGSVPVRGQRRNSPTVDFFRIGVWQGKAFIGERIEVQVRPKPSGKDEVDIFKQSISRDSSGRIRIETRVFRKVDELETRRQLEAGKLDVAVPEKETWHYISVMDCNTSRKMVIKPDLHTASVFELSAPSAAQPLVPAYGAYLFQMRGVQGQDLGFEEIAGIRAHGIKLVFPANPGDPEKLSTDHETESWVSQEWALTLQETYRRPGTNRLNCMKVLTLRSEEPDPTSFEIPPDYQTEIRPAHSSSRDGGYPPESTSP